MRPQPKGDQYILAWRSSQNKTNDALKVFEPRTDRSVAAVNPTKRVPGTEKRALCGASFGIAAVTVIGLRRLIPAALTALQPGNCALHSMVVCITGYLYRSKTRGTVWMTAGVEEEQEM